MFFHGVEPEPDDQPGRDSGDDFGKDKAAAGDGMHHHEINEDEGGGFHSVHTNPDGTQEHGDHATYDEAKADMDSKFGHGGDDSGDGQDDGGDMSMDDMAGSYGRAADCQ